MKRVSLSLLSAACLISLALMVMPSYATTYVFGEDGYNQNLIASGSGSTWTSSNTYIIAGDCYVPDDATLAINAGVTVQFDYNYDGDMTVYPTIDIQGTMHCQGRPATTSASPTPTAALPAGSSSASKPMALAPMRAC